MGQLNKVWIHGEITSENVLGGLISGQRQYKVEDD